SDPLFHPANDGSSDNFDGPFSREIFGPLSKAQKPIGGTLL
ncbi:unnamed protein product, partial [marine sediment metagenome]